MSKPIKLLSIASWALLVVVIVTFFAWQKLRNSGPSKGRLGDAPTFALTDQHGKPVTSESLKGRVWIADFIFTRCAGPCITMTSKMGQIQSALADAPVHLVSFSVDPEFDTPVILQEYAQRNGVKPGRWSLLTGEYKNIQGIARTMLVGVQAATADEPIIHSTHFILIDADGVMYGPYNGEDEEGWKQLVTDARKLARN